jgi:hypothetical protein
VDDTSAQSVFGGCADAFTIKRRVFSNFCIELRIAVIATASGFCNFERIPWPQFPFPTEALQNLFYLALFV